MFLRLLVSTKMTAEQLQQEEEQLLAKLHEIAQQQGQSVQEYLQKLINPVEITKAEATAEHEFPLAKFYEALKDAKYSDDYKEDIMQEKWKRRND